VLLEKDEPIDMEMSDHFAALALESSLARSVVRSRAPAATADAGSF
jgi:hypothetical protein